MHVAKAYADTADKAYVNEDYANIVFSLKKAAEILHVARQMAIDLGMQEGANELGALIDWYERDSEYFENMLKYGDY